MWSLQEVLVRLVMGLVMVGLWWYLWWHLLQAQTHSNNADMLHGDSELYWLQYTPESLTDIFGVLSQSASESADSIENNI